MASMAVNQIWRRCPQNSPGSPVPWQQVAVTKCLWASRSKTIRNNWLAGYTLDEDDAVISIVRNWALVVLEHQGAVQRAALIAPPARPRRSIVRRTKTLLLQTAQPAILRVELPKLYRRAATASSNRRLRECQQRPQGGVGVYYSARRARNSGGNWGRWPRAALRSTEQKTVA